jgi:hypothetical protein
LWDYSVATTQWKVASIGRPHESDAEIPAPLVVACWRLVNVLAVANDYYWVRRRRRHDCGCCSETMEEETLLPYRDESGTANFWERICDTWFDSESHLKWNRLCPPLVDCAARLEAFVRECETSPMYRCRYSNYR